MATLVDVASVGSYFQSLSDPRHTRNRKHLLGDIIVIAVCGILCNWDGPTAIHRWAVNRADWLCEILALPNGIPSRDCIRRLLIALKPSPLNMVNRLFFQGFSIFLRWPVLVGRT